MRLHEYQAKGIFDQFDITVPQGEVAETANKAEEIAEKIENPVVVKAQVHVGGRGKAGGIKFADDPEGVRKAADDILGMDLRGERVGRVLVEERLDVDEEYYVGFTTDRDSGKPAAIVSGEGGMEIEEIAEKAPEKITREDLDPIWPLHEFMARRLALDGGIDKELVWEVSAVARKLYEVYMAKDSTLAEINPLVLTREGNLVTADAVLNVDENALFRQPELASLREETEEDPLIRKAHEYGFDYVRLDGNVGVIGNGAGLVMATLDIIDHFSGRPANFLDVGGGAGSGTVERALEITFEDPNVDVILFNIFGGITRCDEVARGVNDAIEGKELPVPLVVRLAGTNEREGLEILNEDKLEVMGNFEEAVRRAVELAEG